MAFSLSWLKSKLFIGIACLAIVIFAGTQFFYYTGKLKRDLRFSQEREFRLQKDVENLATIVSEREKELSLLKENQAKQETALQGVLGENASWSMCPVPNDVQQCLRGK